MPTQPKYTFLLPAYKAKYFEEALRSIKAQTYRDFRVLVSDDYSPEDLKPIFGRVCGDDPRFTFRRNDENMGGKSLVAHWNILVGICDTEWLIMASDDDVYEPEFLSEIDKLQSKYSQVDLVRARVQSIDENSCVDFVEKEMAEHLSAIAFVARFYEQGIIPCIANYCYRTKTLQEKGGFVDFPAAWFTDDATNFAMAEHGIAVTRQPLFGFRHSGINISSQWGQAQDSKRKVAATYKFYDWMKTYMQQFEPSADKDQADKEWRAKVRSNIQGYIYNCPWGFFLRQVMSCPRGLNLNPLRMTLHKLRHEMSVRSTH